MVCMFASGQKNAHKLFQHKLLAPPKTPDLGPPEKSWCASFPGKGRKKGDPHKLFRWDFGGQGVPNWRFSATKSLVHVLFPALSDSLILEPEVLQSGFGVKFLFWPSEFYENCQRISQRNLMSRFFPRFFRPCFFPGFRAPQKIHAQTSRPELSACLSNFTSGVS